MNVLEKILEEIEEATFQEDAPIYVGDMEVDGYVRASRVKEIIRSHIGHSGDDTEMGDWIPAEERLPEEGTEVLCCFENGTVQSLWQNWKNDGLGNYLDDDLMPTEVIAWQPLPKSYKPKKDISAAGTEHVMSRFMKAE